jgi:VanZ family protein
MQTLYKSTIHIKLINWLWLLIIAYLSLTPQANPAITFDHMDKLLHLGSYGLATLLAFIAYSYSNKLRIILLLFAYSFSMEIGQLFVENRFFEIADLVANLSGILLATYLAKILRIIN